MEFTKSHPDVEDAEKYNFKVEKFADYFGSTGRHHGITNTTINPVHVPIPMAAQKTLFEQAPSHVHYQLAADKIRPNHEYYVDVTQPVGNPGDYPRGFKDFEMSDDFKDSDVLTYQKAEVLKDGQYLTNRSITHDGNKVTWKPNPKSIVPDGSTYTLRIFFKAKNNGVDGANVADNAGTILTDPSQPGDPRGGDTKGDKVTIMGKTLPLSISKDVARIYDTDTHRAVLQDRLQETILDPQHNYDITYHVVLTPGTKGKHGFSLRDPMPDNTTLDKGSVKVTSHTIDGANGEGKATSNNSTDNE